MVEESNKERGSTLPAIIEMNFVAQVEDHLRDLGAEARKAHPGKQE